MSSKTQIVNLALSRIGITKAVANVDTEASREALSAKLIFENERDYCLRKFPWAFATSYVALGLVSGTSSVATNADWVYAYRYPSDAIAIRRILTPLGRKDPNPPPFKIGRDTAGRLIYTNTEDAEIEFTFRVVNTEEFDPLFVSALAWRLAAVLGPALSRIDKIGEKCLRMYEYEISQAEAESLNEHQQEKPNEAEWVAGR